MPTQTFFEFNAFAYTYSNNTRTYKHTLININQHDLLDLECLIRARSLAYALTTHVSHKRKQMRKCVNATSHSFIIHTQTLKEKMKVKERERLLCTLFIVRLFVVWLKSFFVATCQRRNINSPHSRDTPLELNEWVKLQAETNRNEKNAK